MCKDIVQPDRPQMTILR